MTRKKCFSSCRGHPVKECNAPRCKYVNTDKTRYCRLSSKYKMKPPSCRVTRKIKKSQIVPHAQKVIQRFILKHRNKPLATSSETKTDKAEEKETNKIEKASNKVAQFMRRTTQKRREQFLKTICEDSGVCIAFGKEKQKIAQFFNHFVEFDFVQPPIQRIGSSSVNGFVNEIHYRKYNYHAYSVLKSATTVKSDNLAYEYLVGQYINQKLTKFPCFLETYGLYMYATEDKWNHIKDTKTIQTNVLKDSLILLDFFDISTACRNSKYLAILIQHIKQAETLGNYIKDLSNANNYVFVAKNLVNVLYQVYFPLAMMASEFTHYDLHYNNVLLYEPVKGKHIQYHYHVNEKTVVTFRSPYISKIIDYGRCYFKDEVERTSSTELKDELCQNRDCDPSCGKEVGFYWFEKITSDKNYFQSAYHNNPSYDLRLLALVREYLIKQMNNVPTYKLKPFLEFLKYLNYGVGLSEANKTKGTKPNRKSGYPRYTNNVTDAEKGLRDILLLPNFIKDNQDDYKDENKLGDLHVYTNRDMRFVPND